MHPDLLFVLQVAREGIENDRNTFTKISLNREAHHVDPLYPIARIDELLDIVNYHGSYHISFETEKFQQWVCKYQISYIEIKFEVNISSIYLIVG